MTRTETNYGYRGQGIVTPHAMTGKEYNHYSMLAAYAVDPVRHKMLRLLNVWQCWTLRKADNDINGLTKLPTPMELQGMAEVFETIQPGDTRNAAFHLLWFAGELAMGRNPSDEGK